MLDAAAPQTSITFLIGDLNLRSAEDPPFRLGETNSVYERAVFQAPAVAGAHRALWNSILNSLIELHQPHPTHFVAETLSLTRLDKGYTTTPGSWLIKMGIAASIVESADNLAYRGISDHSPVGFSCSAPERKSSSFQNSAQRIAEEASRTFSMHLT